MENSTGAVGVEPMSVPTSKEVVVVEGHLCNKMQIIYQKR